MIAIVFATICALMSIWTYFFYPFLLYLLAKKINHPVKQGCFSANLPRVAVIIPTYNEQKSIRAKLENTMNQDFPKEKLQILVVDSASLDKTADIVEEFRDNVELIRQDARKGKINAINEALKYAKGEIIFVTDANATISNNCLSEIIKNFNDATVGAVQPFHIAIPQNEGVQSEDQTYWMYENSLLEHESMLDSVSSVTCKGLAFRKELVTQLNEEAYADDLDILFQIKKRGYRVIYDADTLTSELIPKNFGEWFKQKKRRTINTIKAMIFHKSIIFNPRYGLFGVVLFPSHKVLKLLSPFYNLFLLWFILTMLIQGENLIASIFMLPFLLVILSVLLINTQFQTNKRGQNLKKSIFRKVLYFIAFQMVVVMAFFESFTYKKKAWDRLDSV